MKTVLITGCSSGIGKETAIYFAKNDWNVAASMRNVNSTEFGGFANIKKIVLDVSDYESITAAIDFAIKTFGAIDVIVNNAGYAAAGAFECASPEQIKKQFDVNVFGLMNVTRAILPYFRSKNKGTIINIASIAGHIAFPTFSLYNSTKFAVEGYSEALQYELNPFNIMVKIVEPGPIKTDFYGRSMDVLENSQIKDYDNFIAPALQKINNSGNGGLLPISVAKVIFKAANSKCNKMHYPVGIQAKVLLLFKKAIPSCLFRWIIKTYMTT
ncbi:MAG: SDR family oxidoreductase [Bacteroidetes bacterium]|nr:SDR family oxidoreductase [Bacteroidota bacterium]